MECPDTYLSLEEESMIKRKSTQWKGKKIKLMLQIFHSIFLAIVT